MRFDRKIIPGISGKSDICYKVLYSQVSKKFNASKSHSRKLHVHVPYIKCF